MGRRNDVYLPVDVLDLVEAEGDRVRSILEVDLSIPEVIRHLVLEVRRLRVVEARILDDGARGERPRRPPRAK